MTFSRTADTSRRGFSLVELLVAIAVIGILAAIVISRFPGVSDAAKATVAGDVLEMANSAVHRFAEGNYEISVAPTSGSTTTEMSVIRTLQYRNPLYPKVGSPYLNPRWNPNSSSSSTDYRLQWAGTLFKLLPPGTAGAGLKVDMEAADLGAPYTFPSNFTMAGQ